MKQRMKKLTAALMAVAMMFSLSVSAFATGGNTTPPTPALPGEQSDTNSTITSQGGLPDDLVTVIMPTASASGGFSVIFDSHSLIADTEAARYAKEDGNQGDVDFEANTQFYFKNYTSTAVDPAPLAKLAVAETSGLPVGTELVTYAKATETTVYVKTFASGDDAGKLESWHKSDGAELVAADWATGDTPGAFAKIAALKDLDPLSGFGLDAIDSINEKDPTIYLRKGAAVSDSNSPVNGMIPYTFVSAYDTNTLRYAHMTVSNGVEGAPDKVFSDVGSGNTPPPAVTGATFSALKDAAGTDKVANALMTVSESGTDVIYGRQLQLKSILSFAKDSAPVKVINKTNVDVGVTMSAELTNVPGGDGSVVSGAQTYVYAKKYVLTETTANGATTYTPHFYSDEAGATEIIGGNSGVPVIYMALKGTNGTAADDKTAVLAYNSTDKKATASISSVITGKPDFYGKTWEGTSSTDTNGKYVYVLNKASYAKRQADFNYMQFQLTGAIDKDDDVWNTLAEGTSAPAIKVTWKVEAKVDVKAPTITAPTTAWKAAAQWTPFTITKNPDLATLSKIQAVVGQNTVDVADTNITTSIKATTGLGTITFAANTFSAKPSKLIFVFQHPTKAFCTVNVELDIT